jgi:fucose 4-O-acetylase-like acetyltransferase
LDALKGFGILTVVLGHMLSKECRWSDLRSLFAMPLFFFISGYLFKPCPDAKRYLQTKALHLLVPYAAFLILLFFIPQLVAALQAPSFDLDAFKRIIMPALLGGRELQGPSGIFWFVTCLFATQQLVNQLVPRYAKSKLLLIFGGMLVLSGLHSSYSRQYWLPWTLNVVLASAPIFYAGHLFRQVESALSVRLLAALASLAAVAAIAAGFDLSFDMKSAFYGIPGISVLCALAIVIVSIDIAKRVERLPALSDALSALGRASLVIMFLHQTLLAHSRSFFGMDHEILRFGFVVLVSCLAYELMLKFSVLKALLLGSEPECLKLLSHANDAMGGIPARLCRRLAREVQKAGQETSLWAARGRLLLGPKQQGHGLPGELIVSLTSHPRFPALYATLVPLLVQSVRADRVILWVAHGDRQSLPDRVKRLTGKGLEIRATVDVGPYTKIIPALRAFPHAFIVTADDDTYYDRTWLRDLLRGWDDRSNQIVFHRGHRIAFDESGGPRPYRDWIFCIPGPQESVDIFPTGVGGVLYPPGSLSSDVLNEDAFRMLCPKADDLWLYWMGRRAGSIYKKTGDRNNVPVILKSDQAAALWHENGGGRNDRYIARLIETLGWPGKPKISSGRAC